MTLAKRGRVLWLRLWWMGKLLRAEKEPDPAKMRQLMHAISDLHEEDKKEIFTCRICNKPLQLETDTRTDEDGKAVHEECYVKHLTAQPPRQGIQFQPPDGRNWPHFCSIDRQRPPNWMVILAQPPRQTGLVIFLIHRSILLSFFRCLEPMLLGMYESGEELLHPEEIQQRFKKVFRREMTRTERDIFFLPLEPPLEQEDEG